MIADPRPRRRGAGKLRRPSKSPLTAATARRSTTHRRAFAITIGTRREAARRSCSRGMERSPTSCRFSTKSARFSNSVCSSEAQRAAFVAQIAATAAWALALEADVAARLNASCPAAAQALPTMMLSDAWLSLANVVNDDGGVGAEAVQRRDSKGANSRASGRPRAAGLVGHLGVLARSGSRQGKGGDRDLPHAEPSPSAAPSTSLRVTE